MELNVKDRVVLNSGDVLEIWSNQPNEPYVGLNAYQIVVYFRYKDIKCVNKFGVNSCGGDNENYWYFYCGNEYKKNTKENIAHWAKYNLIPFKDMDVDEIQYKHIYFGSEGPSYHSKYNGDMYVLFNNLNKYYLII